MDFYEFYQDCISRGLTSEEAEDEYYEMIAERKQRRKEEYENDPIVQYGWYQQDIIDMYRRER